VDFPSQRCWISLPNAVGFPFPTASFLSPIHHHPHPPTYPNLPASCIAIITHHASSVSTIVCWSNGQEQRDDGWMDGWRGGCGVVSDDAHNFSTTTTERFGVASIDLVANHPQSSVTRGCLQLCNLVVEEEMVVVVK
jgi:hypothetical protein